MLGTNPKRIKNLFELAENDRNNKKNQNRNNSNGDYPIRSHSETMSVNIPSFCVATVERMSVPTGNALEALDAAVDIAFALVEDVGGVLDGLALLLQLRKRAGSDGLGLVRQRLAGLESLCAAVQPLSAYEHGQP